MRNWRGYTVVFGASIVQLTLGTIFTCGNLGPYLISYMHIQHGSEVTLAYIVWINALQIAGQGLLMCVGGIIERRIGSRYTGLIGCAIMSTGTLLTYFTIDMSFVMFLLTYGVLYGLGISIGYIAMVSVGMKWFPNNRGLVNGLTIGAFGFGSFVFNQVQTVFLNPNNVTPDKDGYFRDKDLLERVPYVFLLLGGIYLGMQIIGCLMVTKAPEQVNIGQPIPAAASSISPRQVIKTKEFYNLFFTMLLNVTAVTYFNSMYKAYGQTFISDDYFLTLVGAFTAVFNASGRVVWGVLIDRFPYKHCMLTLCSCVIALLVSIPQAGYGGKPMYAIWCFSLIFSMAGTYTLIATITSRVFGPKHAGSNFGLVFFNSVIGGPMTAVLSQFLNVKLGYSGMFYLLSGFSAISFLLTLMFKERSVAEEINGLPVLKETVGVSTVSKTSSNFSNARIGCITDDPKEIAKFDPVEIAQ